MDASLPRSDSVGAVVCGLGFAASSVDACAADRRIDGADRPAGVWRGVARRPGALIQRALGAAELSFTTALQARFAQRLLGGRFAQRSDLKCKRHG